MRKSARYLLTFSLIVIILTCGGCCRQEESGVSAELQAAIDSFYAAIENGDVEGHIAAFADSAIMMPNHWTITRGKETIGTSMRSAQQYVFRLRDREVVDIDVSGNIAYTVNSYSYTWHLKDAEPQWHKTKNVHIWKKDSSGDWKLHVDIWNSDVPIDQFSEE